MSSHPFSTSGSPFLARRLAGVGALLAAIVLSGCTAGGLPTSPTGSSGAPVTSPSAAPAASSSSPSSAAASPSVAPMTPATTSDAPPAASLAWLPGPATPGELGGYTWGGGGSDAPWVVPPADRAVHARGPYTVAFTPPLEVAGWKAAWAPVTDGGAGTPAGSASGTGAPIVVAGPDRAGTWSLQVDVQFAAGGRAAWYWRVELAP
jgi:hypothetical protein